MQKILVKKGFTLLELLIVIGILAVLSTAVVLVLNPAQLLAEARDSQRLADLRSIQTAIAFFLTTVVNPTFGEGPNSTATSTPCAFSVCKFNATTTVDGLGWVSVDLRKTTGGSPLASLPIDPVNDTMHQYAYAANNKEKTFELNTRLESNKFRTLMASDGGNMNTCSKYTEDTCYFETGTAPGLKLGGLIGYWKLDETTGPTSVDSSGNGNKGTWMSSPLPVIGKVNGALSFNGTNYVGLGNLIILRLTGAMSVSAWILSNSSQNTTIVSKLGDAPQRGWDLSTNPGSFNSTIEFRISSTCSDLISSGNSTELSSGIWHHIVGVYNPSTAVRIYLNGNLSNENTSSIPATQCNSSHNVNIAARGDASGKYIGQIDDVRIFNRVLSPEEITALYNATK